MIKNKSILKSEVFYALCVRFLAVLSFAVLFSISVSAQSDSDKKVKTHEEHTVLAEFVTDGCTFFPDGNYFDCCVQHDREYYAGGTGKKRWRSDKKLFLCVAAKPKFYNKFVAPVMWLGVRVGGVAWLKASFSWGFGKNKAYLRKVAKKKGLPAKETK